MLVQAYLQTSLPAVRIIFLPPAPPAWIQMIVTLTPALQVLWLISFVLMVILWTRNAPAAS